MNAKAVVVLLLLAGLVTGGVYWYRHTTRIEADTRQRDSIATFSNTVAQTTTEVKTQTEERAKIEGEIARWTREALSLSNELARATVALDKSQTELASARVAAETAEAAANVARASLLERDGRIRSLEAERDSLASNAQTLRDSISKLESNLTELTRKLNTSEGDREFLIAELKRLQSEKAEWERKFHDLEALRDQYRAVRAEELLARRRDWRDRGVYNNSLKGGQLLMRGFSSPRAREEAPAGDASTNPDLNVEISREARPESPANPPAPR